MSVIKLHTYCGNTCSSIILDSSKQGKKTIKIDRTISGLQEDISYAVDSANDRFTVFADYFEFKAGGPYLTPGSFIEITSGKHKFVAVVTDFNVNEYYNYYSIKGKGEVSIGRSSSTSICYSYGNFISNKPHCLLAFDKDYRTYFLKNTSESPSIYVNGCRVDSSLPLYFGDEIHILGLSVIFLGSVLAINNPSEMLTTSLSPCREDIFNVASIVEESEFARSTRIYKSPVKESFLIEPPVSKNENQKLPAALTVGPSITMGVSMVASMMVSISSASSSGGSPVMGILMSGSMLAGMLVWPNAIRKWQHKREKEEEVNRKKVYIEYIEKCKENLVENLQFNLNILNENLVDSKFVAEWIFDPSLSRRIWERSYYDKDFIEIKLGVGRRKNISTIEIPRTSYLSQGDELNKLALLLKNEYEYLEGAPVSVDLKQLNSVGLIGSPSSVYNMAVNMVFQLAALQDSSELKMVFIYDDKNKKKFEWIKKLPHIWNNELDFRFVAKNKDEVQTLFRYLSSELENRSSEDSKRNHAPTPNYVVFALSKELIEDVSIAKFVSADYDKTGFASVFAFGNINTIPSGCKALIQCSKDKCGIYSNIDNEKGFTQFVQDEIDPNAVFKFSNAMALFKTYSGTSKAGIPTSVNFLDLFSAASIEEMDILSRWSESNPQKSLAVPIGVKSGGEFFMLDIHEKYHGSHGLLAGTTGSGKSECIQTLILSLAVNFHPDDVSFVLIDFKGGGMANCFTGMPHISGTITNIGNQIRRSMIALNSELKRRQTLLKEAGVNHIDKYQALYKSGEAKEPMPHLVIVSDEFAELKQQQPEFMSELISIARIGRSLGVHLILATQKPSGVVDDQIWSNTRFRVCLKVADKSDSIGMVSVPLAAGITLPGRGYVQVGYNEVFELVQTAYTGAEYVPTEKFINKEQQRVLMLDDCGQVINSAEVKAKALKSIKKQSQLEAVVGYLSKISIENNINANLIWQEPLKKILTLGEIALFNEMKESEKNNIVKSVVGIVDDIEMQSVEPLVIDLSAIGHTVIYGMPGSGKTTMLQTLIFSTLACYTEEQVIFNILDFGGRVLELFSAAPQVDKVFFKEDADKLEQVFTEIIEEMEFRHNKFARVRQENLASYRKATGEKLPAIVIIIDNFAKFYEECNELEELIGTLIREGAKYGITLLVTANTVNAISYKFSDYFLQKYTLQMADSGDYTAIMGSTLGMKPENVKGRGLMRYEGRLVEYQTALAFDELEDGLRSELIQSEIQKLFGDKNTKTSKARTIEVNTIKDKHKEKKSGFSMPGLGVGSSSNKKIATAKNKEKFKTYLVKEENSIVIAQNRKTAEEYALELKEHPAFYIIHDQLDSNTLILNLANKILNSNLGRVEYFTHTQKLITEREKLNLYKDEVDLTKLIDRLQSYTDEVVYVLIDNFMDFYKAISNEDLARLETMLPSLKERKIFIIAAALLTDAEILKDYPLGIFLFKTCPRGMLAGGKAIDAGSVLPNILINKLSYEDLNYSTSINTALLFDEKGDSAKVTPTFVS
jgi:S-DNA-T family DNA segregation ATPase FtsK/SpoIIIE